MVAPLFRRKPGAISIVMEHHPNPDRNKRTTRGRSALLADPDRDPGYFLRLPTGREGWLVARRVRVARRGLAALAWTLPAMLIQAVCLILPGHAKVAFAQMYWAVFARLIGIKVQGDRHTGETLGGAPGDLCVEPFILGGRSGPRRRVGWSLRRQARGRGLARRRHNRPSRTHGVRLAQPGVHSKRA